MRGIPDQLDRSTLPFRTVRYEDFRTHVRNLDIGLVAGSGPLARQIQRLTDSPYSHAFLCGWCAGVLMVAESTFPESRLVSLSSRVAADHGQIDIYRLRPSVLDRIDARFAWSWALRASGVNYPERQLLADWMEIALGIDNDRPNSDEPTERRVCSGFVHAALRVAGMAPMRDLDCDVYPGTLADPDWTEYLFTLEV